MKPTNNLWGLFVVNNNGIILISTPRVEAVIHEIKENFIALSFPCFAWE
jgi:hypothetical protein